MELTELITHLVFQLALIFLAAKIGGEIAERVLRVPPVLGELAAGIIIGPFALGGIPIGNFGPLFPLPHGSGNGQPAVPVSVELYSISQIAAIVLLFVAGLETNFRLFLKYVGPAFLVATGGLVLPFLFGAYATVYFGFAGSLMDPHALFMGAVMTATSVGITARILRDTKKLDTPEGVTILGAAVVDDVLGILVLTIVVAIAATGIVSPGQVTWIGIKALGFWIALTGVGVLLSGYISRILLSFRVEGGGVALALALALAASGLAEAFGLAMIIGAYSIGLALSPTEVAKRVREPLEAVSHALVPVFFVVMGMLVNVPAMRSALIFGLVISILAIVGKVVGSGVPALGVGFNMRGAWRIGLGMLPRGEVALIVAGVGLSRGVITSDIFGVAIMMTAITTLLAPILLVPAFERGGRGTRKL